MSRSIAFSGSFPIGKSASTSTKSRTTPTSPPLSPAATKWRLFFKSQARNPNYLKNGDVVEIRIATDDGAIDLGVQRTTVRWAK